MNIVKHFRISLIVLWSALVLGHAPSALAAPAVVGDSGPRTDSAALEHWTDLRFGIMFHWSPAVLRNQEISWSMSNRAKYEAVYARFNPKHFDADAWINIATQANAHYVVYVCKHHDGFCMWDTDTTSNNIMHTPFKRDVVAELAVAAQRQNLFFGTYLSIMDIHEANWNRCYAARTEMPGYPEGIPHIEDITARQTLELLKKYHSQLMWYDGAWLQGWRTSSSPARVMAQIKAYNPQVLITRLGNQVDDFGSMEAKIGAYRATPWEMVTSTAYPTYSWNDHIKFKSAGYFLQILSRVACGNGNLLLNFVPDADGAICPEQQGLARGIGGWLATNGAAIFGTRGGPWYPNNWGGSTRTGKTIYLHLLPDAPDHLVLPACGAKVMASKVLGGGDVTVTETAAGLELTVPPASRNPAVTVIELAMDTEVPGMIEASKPQNAVIKKSDLVPPPAEEIKK